MRDRCRRRAQSGLGDGKAGARTSSNDGRSQEQEEASGRFEARPVTKRTAPPFECVMSTAASGEFRHGRRMILDEPVAHDAQKRLRRANPLPRTDL